MSSFFKIYLTSLKVIIIYYHGILDNRKKFLFALYKSFINYSNDNVMRNDTRKDKKLLYAVLIK